jgi:hypothetical protein
VNDRYDALEREPLIALKKEHRCQGSGESGETIIGRERAW